MDLSSEIHRRKCPSRLVKYPVPFLLSVFAAVCALLGLEWLEMHGGPVLIPPKDIVFAILIVSPLATALNALVRCHLRVKRSPAAG